MSLGYEPSMEAVSLACIDHLTTADLPVRCRTTTDPVCRTAANTNSSGSGIRTRGLWLMRPAGTTRLPHPAVPPARLERASSMLGPSCAVRLRHGGKIDLTVDQEPAVGLEPTTSALRKRPLFRSGSLATSRRPASNRHPPPYRGGALPLELRRHVPALPLSYAPSGGATQCPLPGFPLRVPPLHGYRVAAHHLAGRRESNPRLGRATGGTRTPNAQFRRLALCPLSYYGKAVRASFDLAASAVTRLRSSE